LKFLEEQQNTEKQLNKIKNEYNQLIKEYEEKKEKLEIQLGEVNNNLLQVSESLSESTQTANLQREKFQKQIVNKFEKKIIFI
jgi:ABC-type transporter Mla subunit MlaD